MASGQFLSVQSGAPTTIRADAVLTNAYVATTSLDLGSYTSVTLFFKIGTAQAKTCNIKFQWSYDGTTWFYEQVEVAGTAGTGDQPYVSYDRRIDLDITSSTTTYSCRFNRMAQFFRAMLKSDATTTGTIAVLAQKSSLTT